MRDPASRSESKGSQVFVFRAHSREIGDFHEKMMNKQYVFEVRDGFRAQACRNEEIDRAPRQRAGIRVGGQGGHSFETY